MEIENPPVKIFYSYARKDKVLLDKLLTHINPLERSGLITQWYDGQIAPGEHWSEEIAFHLRTADVILLLITPAFIASDYAYEFEMKVAIEAEKKGFVQVIPIIMRPTEGWEEDTFFGHLQALPEGGKPVTKWHNHDEAWENVVGGVKKTIRALPDSRRAARTLAYIQEAHDEAHDDSRLLAFLKWKYEKKSILQLLKRGEKTYPVAVYPASAEQMREPESVRLGLKLDIPPYSDEGSDEGPLADKEFRNWLMQAKPVAVENKLTYCMKKFEIGDQLRFECQMGWYNSMLDTCESLEWEILSKIGQLKGSDDAACEEFDRELKQRSLFHTEVGDPIGDGHLRSVALSVSTLIAFNDEGVLYLWLQRRTPEVATHAGFFHLIPSGIFQPEFPEQRKREFSVKHNVHREYLEEIFNYPRPKTAHDYRWFYKDSRLQYLEDLLREGKAEFYFSGVAVSPLNFRPEICTVLLFRSADWYDHHIHDGPDTFKLNQEWEPNEPMVSGQRSVIRIPFSKVASNGDLVEPMNNDEIVEYMLKEESLHLDVDRMVPVGAGSFWLGIDVLRRVLAQPEM
jgi:hypothetical protein